MNLTKPAYLLTPAVSPMSLNLIIGEAVHTSSSVGQFVGTSSPVGEAVVTAIASFGVNGSATPIGEAVIPAALVNQLFDTANIIAEGIQTAQWDINVSVFPQTISEDQTPRIIN